MSGSWGGGVPGGGGGAYIYIYICICVCAWEDDYGEACTAAQCALLSSGLQALRNGSLDASFTCRTLADNSRARRSFRESSGFMQGLGTGHEGFEMFVAYLAKHGLE